MTTPNPELATFWERAATPDTEAWRARVDLAEAGRRLADATVTTRADAAALQEATALIGRALACLPSGPSAREALTDGTYDPAVYIDRTAVFGACNPVAPPLRPVSTDQGSTASLTLTDRYGGAPGLAHGGIVAAIHDQMCGHVMVAAGYGCLTGRITVSYRAPTRLHTPLVFSARITAQAGRRFTVQSQCVYGEELISEAEALMIAMDSARARRVFEKEA